VILRDGALVAVAGRGERSLTTFLPAEEPDRAEAARAIAASLAAEVDEGRRRAVLVSKIDGEDPASSPLAAYLRDAGFVRGSRGFLKRAAAPSSTSGTSSASSAASPPDA
jgi:hypothetical protein